MSRLFPALLFALALVGNCLRAPAQSNDSFANRLTLTGSAPIAVSNNLRATRETGEPSHAGAGAGRSLWYTWTAPATGIVNIGTYSTRTGAPLMRAVAVYTGDSYATLSEAASSNNQTQVYYTQGYANFLPYAALFAGGTSVNLSATAGTVYQIAVDALPAFGSTDDGTVVLAINAPPTILSAASVVGTTGASFSFTVQAGGGATAFAASDLPTGLVLNAASGQITGTPAATGTYNVALTATGPGGAGTGTLTIRVTDPAPVTPTVPVLNSAASARGYVGAAFSYSISASGSPTDYSAASLPDGLSLNATTGAITGTPTATGTFAVPISATGPGGTGTATLTILVDSPPLPILTSYLTATGTTGSYLSYYLYTNLDSYSGLAPTSYSADNLPPGLTLASATTKYFSGTPTQAGVYAVPISVTNAAGTRRAVVTVTISDPVTTTPAATGVPVLGSLAWSTGVVGSAFSYALSASNTPTGYGASGLPPGVTFDAASGRFAGTPTAAGTFLVPVTATNGYGTSSGTLTVMVYASAAAQNAAFGNPQPFVTSAASAVASVGQTFSYGITALFPSTSNTVISGSYWNFSATGLPPGLSVTGASSSLGNGTISGTPTKAGVYPATITVLCPANTNPSNGPVHPNTTGTAVVTFIVNAAAVPTPAPVIVGGAMATGSVGSSLVYSPSGTNSPSAYAASDLPPGLTISGTDGTVSGIPTAAGTYSATISATNATGTGTARVTFLVAAVGALPQITSSATPTGTVGQSFSYGLSTGSAATGYGLGSNLPPGLTFNASTGVFGGTPTQAGVFTLPVSATNAAGTTGATLTITIQPAGVIRPPAITSAAVTTATVGVSFYYSIGTDVNASSYGAGSNLPPGLSFSASNGSLSGTPTAAGTYTVPLSVTNAAGTGTATLTVLVALPPLPNFTSDAVMTAMAGQSFSNSVYASNCSNGYAFSGLPAGITQNSAGSAYISGTPTAVGTYTVAVSATNANGTANAALTFVVTPASVAAPVITSAPSATGYVNHPFSYTLAASGTPTSYNVGGLPAGLKFNALTNTISGKISAAGSYSMALSATNAGGTGTATLSLAVSGAATTPPLVTSPAVLVAPLRQAFYHFISTDSPATAYSATGLPAGISLDPATGTLSGTPTASGNYPVSVTVTGGAGQSQATLTLVVNNPSFTVFTQPAVFSLPAGQAFSATLATNSTSLYNTTASPLPAGLSLTPSTGVVSGTPTAAGVTSSNISQYNYYGYAYGRQLFQVYSAAPVAPVITSPAGVGAYAGMTFCHQLQATNSPTGFTASGLPAGLTLDTDTGRITGIPTSAGSYAASVTAYNTRGTSQTATITFAVATATSDVPAQITSAATATGVAGAPFSYALTVNGPYVYVGNYANLPPGLQVNPSTGVVSGTPTAAGTFATGFSVRDSTSGTVNAPVTFIILAAANRAPTLTSAAGASGAVGYAFSYAISAGNGPTSYAATSLPAGLSFNAATGVISGTPTVAGTYTIALGASNTVGTGTGTLTFVVAPISAPSLASGPPLERDFSVGDASSTGYSWYVNASGAVTSYAASPLPPGLGFDTGTGHFTGAFTTPGSYPVTVSATNGSGTASAVITYVVTAAAASLAPPIINGLSASLVAFAGSPISSFTLSATNAPKSFAASGLPPGMSLSTPSGQIAGTPTAAGTYTVNLSATNAAGTGTAVWTVVVKDSSVLTPVFSSPAAQLIGTVGTSTSYGIYAYAYYGIISTSVQTVLTVSGLPAGVQVGSSSGNYLQISGAPLAAGSYPLTITSTAPGGATATAVCTLVVQPAPAPKIISAAGALGNQGSAFSYTLYATNTVTSYSADTLPPGLAFDPATGRITGTPTATGTYPVSIGATGPYGTASAFVTIRIDGPLYGGLPVITSAATISSQENPSSFLNFYSLYYGNPTAVSYTLTALNSPTSWTATGVPDGMSFNPYTATLSGQPTATGTFLVPVSASNAAGTVTATLTIISTAYLTTSYVSLASSGSVGSSYYAGVSLYYPAISTVSPYYNQNSTNTTSDPITYSAVGLPPGLSINSSTGTLTGVPTVAGTYPITLTTANRAGSSSTVTTLAVAATPGTPGTPSLPAFSSSYAQAAGFVGLPLSYNLYATGVPGFAATVLPPGLSLNPVTGVVSGTPTAPGVWPVTVTAANAAGTAQATLTVTVDAAPPAPVLSSACATSATSGVAFGYSISASNYSGLPSPIAYAASGLPAGLTLNPASGYISGTPTGQAGVYAVPVAASVGPATTANGVLTIIVQSAPAPTAPLLGSPTGALGLVGNPFRYTPVSAAFAPTVALPAGLSYDAATGGIGGYPTAPGTYVIPMAAGGTGNKGSDAARDRRPPTIPLDGGNPANPAVTIRVIAPQYSLPRLTAQPVSGSGMEGDAFAFHGAAVGVPDPAFQWNRNTAPLAGATGADLTLSPLQTTDTGNYTLTVGNAAGSVTSPVAALLVQTVYPRWQADHFSAQEIAAGQADPSYSFSGDGVSNLLKYAFDLDPRGVAAGNATQTVSRPAADGTLTLGFVRDAGHPDLNYLVEASADLRAWTTVAESDAGAAFRNLGAASVTETVVPGTGQSQVTVKTLPSPGGAVFLRVRIVRP